MSNSRIPGIVVGHSNMDLDCLGAMALARRLFPGYWAVQSRQVHPPARPLVTLYRVHLDLVPSKELKGQTVDHLVVVDTRSLDRVKEYLDLLAAPPSRIDVFDHHPPGPRDIPGARVHDGAFGSATTLLGTLLMEANVPLHPDDATIALTGIYADTGSFTYSNVTEADFRVAAYLLGAGASLSLVRTFLAPLRERGQGALLRRLMENLSTRHIRGNSILFSYLELEEPIQGISPVVEKVFETEQPDAYFAVFWFRNQRSTLIIARNRKEGIELDRILAVFGGGGHTKAASATVKGTEGREVLRALVEFLERSLAPALSARDIMTRNVTVVSEETSLLETALLLERMNFTGCPVVGNGGALTGFVTLRDIQKGRRAGQMHAPVKAYMTRKVVTASPGATLREVEELLLTHNIGHLPILDQGRIVGILTRTDYLALRRGERELAQSFRNRLGPKAHE